MIILTLNSFFFSLFNFIFFSCKKSFCLILLNTDAIQDKKEVFVFLSIPKRSKQYLSFFKDVSFLDL